MSTICKAEEIFKDLPKKEKDLVFKIAEGKTVYFPKEKTNKIIINETKACEDYAKGKSFREIGKEDGVSGVAIFRIIKKEREGYSRERIEFWQKQGLSLREIARLFKNSHEAVRNSIKS